jgi:hypothetical protein
MPPVAAALAVLRVTGVARPVAPEFLSSAGWHVLRAKQVPVASGDAADGLIGVRCGNR